jgi:hypothetical protein
VNVAVCTLAKQENQLRSGWKNTNKTSDLQMDKSAVVEHSFNNSHKILFQDTAICSTNLECLITAAIEVDLHPNNISREEGLTLSTSWRPILRHLEEKISINLDHPPP